MLFTAAGCTGKKAYVFEDYPKTGSYKPFSKAGELALGSTDGLELAAQNDYLQLFYDKSTYAVTVFDRRNGKIYTTYPAGEASGGDDTKLALLNLTYSNTQGKTGTIDSYTESVLLNQVETEKNGDEVTFIYSIGDVSDGLEVTPSVISNERFTQLLEKADEAQKKILKRRYSYIKDSDKWSRRKIINSSAIEELIDVFSDIGYTKEDLAADNAENGVSDSKAEKLSFTVPITFRLDGDSLIFEIQLESVKYPSSNPLVYIEALPFFGAVGADAQGYFLIPDGSGAVMPFDTVESGALGYEGAVYGADKAMRSAGSAASSKDIFMPVFGACYNENGFLAVIEQGEALSDILAYNSGSNDAYNKIYSRLNFLKTESVSLGNQNSSDNFNYYHFQEKPYGGSYSVRYMFLEENDCDYCGMARCYRNFLLSTGRMDDKKAAETAPFVLETVGGILSEKSILGFRYKGITALTEYEENCIMAAKLAENGVENINLRLTSFSGDGLQNLPVNKSGLIGNLGGSKGLKALIETADKQGFTVYPDYQYLTFSANSGVLTKNSYAIKSMDLKAVELPVLNPATLKKDTQITDNLYYLTSIGKLAKINEAAEKMLDKYGIRQMSIADMAHSVSSDFSPGSYYDRQSASNYAGNVLSVLSEKYILMLSGANAVNTRYAALVTDAPLWSSQYMLAEGVPFYSMVYHGLVNYTGEAINLFSDSRREFLRCIEYGASLKYKLIYKNKSAVKDSDYTWLYSAGFEDNLAEASEYYRMSSQLYSEVSEAAVTGHKKLAESVYYTEYSNGVYTVVNYSDKEYLSDYGAVPAENYIISKREMKS